MDLRALFGNRPAAAHLGR